MLRRWTLALQAHLFKFAMLNWIFPVLMDMMFSYGYLRLNNFFIITIHLMHND